MFSVFNYRILPIECVSLNISFVQHVVNIRHSGYGNYKALSMKIYTNVRTIIMCWKKPEDPSSCVVLVVVTISDHSPFLSFSIRSPKGIPGKHYI